MPYDSEDLERSVADLLPDLRAYVRLKCGPRLREQESCSDLVQSTLREVLRELGRDPASEPGLRARAFRAAEQKIIDRARHWARDKRDWRRRQGLDDPGQDEQLAQTYAALTSPTQAALGREAIEHLEAAFDAIPERYREAILLQRSAGLSYEEIGERLGMSPHSARTYVSRALARLAAVYGQASRTTGEAHATGDGEDPS